MSDQSDNIHPEYDRQVGPEAKQELLGQSGAVLWLYGLSGSGKSTIANMLEKKLHDHGRYVIMLDGDNLRSGLNAGLGFTDEDRNENIRRAAELAKLLSRNGAIVIVSLITPQEKFRSKVREIIPAGIYSEIYIKASFDTCKQRDVKGLYAKQAAGEIKHFSGAESSFEEPHNAELTIDTESQSIEQSLDTLYSYYLANHSK